MNITKDEYKCKDHMNMIFYVMQNVQNVIKVMYDKQEEDCKIRLINIREKLISLIF